ETGHISRTIRHGEARRSSNRSVGRVGASQLHRRPQQARGKRIGVWRGGGDMPSVNAVTDQTIANLRARAPRGSTTSTCRALTMHPTKNELPAYPCPRSSPPEFRQALRTAARPDSLRGTEGCEAIAQGAGCRVEPALDASAECRLFAIVKQGGDL